MLLHFDPAVLTNVGNHFVLVLETAHESRGAAIHETLRETLVQGIGESILDRARALLPMRRIGEPFGAVRHERPGADVRDGFDNVSMSPVGALGDATCLGEPVLGDRPSPVIRNLNTVPASSAWFCEEILR